MTKGRYVEIIPPGRPPAITASPPVPVSSNHNPGGPVAGVLNRWVADSQRRTYDSYSGRTVAQTRLVEEHTKLGTALIEHQRVMQRYAELPAILVHDREVRQLQRDDEIAALQHQIAIGDSQRERDRLYEEARRREVERVVLDAEQQLDAQREYGPRLYALQWEHKLNDWEIKVDTQREVLNENRRRPGREEPTLDELYLVRDKLNASGADTTPIDNAINRILIKEQRSKR